MSMSGITLALGICAAAWYTAGTTSADLIGTLALGTGYLSMAGARRVADSARDGWAARLGARVFSCVVYAGLAAGAAAQGWGEVWPLAIAVLSLVSIRETMTACSGGAETGVAGDGLVKRAILTALAMPAGGRVLVIMVAAPAWGTRVALLGLLDWGIIAIGYGITTRSATWRRGGRRRPAPAPRPAAAAESAESVGLAVLFKPARPAPQSPGVMVEDEPELKPDWAEPHGQPVVVRTRAPVPPAVPAAIAGDGSRASGEAAADWDMDDDEPADWEDEPTAVGPADAIRERALAVVLRCRDDGVIARWFGGLARGQLIPLPPALLALAAVAVLARLGLRDLPGLLILAPAIVMLVAAPGSSHRHDGRLDWLVPGVLQGAQFTYIAALGFASGVPVAVTFTLCAAVALRYADIGSGGSPVLRTKAGHEHGAWLGWDGRMLVCGLGAAMGIAIVAYLALAAYLAALVCWKVADRLR